MKDRNYYSDGTTSEVRDWNKTLHREDGPAVEYQDQEYKAWYLNGWFHRIDGPAREHRNGGKAWYLNGLRHRADAIDFTDGRKEWYLEQYSEEEYNKIMKEVEEMSLELRLTDSREWVRRNVVSSDGQRDQKR